MKIFFLTNFSVSLPAVEFVNANHNRERSSTMKQLLLGSIVGAIILFVWSFLAWVILPMHTSTMHPIPNEDAVRAFLKSQLPLPNSAVYTFPHNPEDKNDQAAMNVAMEKWRQGPLGMIFFDPQGADPMMPSQMVVGFIIDLVSCFLAAWFLTRSTAMTGSYINRVAFFGMLGIFVSVYNHLIAWNWMGFPADFTRGLILDTILSWVLVGLGMAAIIKAPRQTVEAK